MRVANLVPDVEYNIQQSNQALATAEQQVATGQRVNQPSDDPAASANLVTSLAASASVDQYTSNIGAVTSQLQTADSAISSVVTNLTSAISLGTEGGTGTTSDSQRQSIATQVQGVLGNVVSAAKHIVSRLLRVWGHRHDFGACGGGVRNLHNSGCIGTASADRDLTPDGGFGHHHKRRGNR